MNRKYYLPGTYPYYEYDENMYIIFNNPQKIYSRKLDTTVDILYEIISIFTYSYPHPRSPGIEQILLDWVKFRGFDYADAFYFRFDIDHPGGRVEITTLNVKKIEIDISCFGPREESKLEMDGHKGRMDYFYSLANHIEEKFFDQKNLPQTEDKSDEIQNEKTLSSKMWEVIENENYREIVRL